jgi:hypothetical protein
VVFSSLLSLSFFFFFSFSYPFANKPLNLAHNRSLFSFIWILCPHPLSLSPALLGFILSPFCFAFFLRKKNKNKNMKAEF